MIIVPKDQQLNNALYCLKANNQYITLPNSILTTSVSSAFSISGWFYCTALSAIQGGYNLIALISNRYDITLYGVTCGYLYNSTTSQFFIQLIASNTAYNIAYYNISPGSVLNRWNHFVLTKGGLDVSTYNFYLNGISINASSTTNNLTSSSVTSPSYQFTINAFGNSSSYTLHPYMSNCYFSTYMFYTKALTSTEVLSLYKYPNTIPSTALSNLVANYPFTNYNGESLTETVSGNNGSLVNFALSITATSPNPQSGNTAWINTYNMTPITT